MLPAYIVMQLFCLRACALIFAAACFIGTAPAPRALEMIAVRDVLPVFVTAEVSSLLGDDLVLLPGWVQIDRAPPHLEDGVEVTELEVTSLDFVGASRLGITLVTERPDDGPSYRSAGELRALQSGSAFPASSFLDLFVDASIPDSPFGSLLVHNEAPLRLTPRAHGDAVALTSWPPFAVSYELEPLFLVDNDGDGAVDEDTADEDGDGLVDEDRPGPDPATPGVDGCGDDADCDGTEGEDPPATLCDAAVCDDDGDGLVDEDPACVPLLTETNTHLKLGLCLRGLAIEFAPELPSYSVAPGGPSRAHPADVLSLTPLSAVPGSGEAPFARITCAALGLSADGCDDGADGDQDDLNALSYGDDAPAAGTVEARFSVGEGARGLPGSAVRTQSLCPPAQPGASPEPQGDVFGSLLNGTNVHVFDGNGPVGACAAAFPLGLVEAATQRDDVDGFHHGDASVVDGDADGVPERPVYFSLAAGSPSLGQLGRSPADVLSTVDGRAPVAYAPAAALGLRPGDDVDGLCLREDGDGVFGAGDVVYFSLAAGSPTLARVGAAPGDVLAPGRPPRPVQRAAALGLAQRDDVDALGCEGRLARAGGGDVNCDGATSSVDAALVLQYNARLIESLPCAEDGDVNGDGGVTSVDAALILQLEAGLIGSLPV